MQIHAILHLSACNYLYSILMQNRILLVRQLTDVLACRGTIQYKHPSCLTFLTVNKFSISKHAHKGSQQFQPAEGLKRTNLAISKALRKQNPHVQTFQHLLTIHQKYVPTASLNSPSKDLGLPMDTVNHCIFLTEMGKWLHNRPLPKQHQTLKQLFDRVKFSVEFIVESACSTQHLSSITFVTLLNFLCMREIIKDLSDRYDSDALINSFISQHFVRECLERYQCLSLKGQSYTIKFLKLYNQEIELNNIDYELDSKVMSSLNSYTNSEQQVGIDEYVFYWRQLLAYKMQIQGNVDIQMMERTLEFLYGHLGSMSNKICWVFLDSIYQWSHRNLQETTQEMSLIWRKKQVISKLKDDVDRTMSADLRDQSSLRENILLLQSMGLVVKMNTLSKQAPQHDQHAEFKDLVERVYGNLTKILLPSSLSKIEVIPKFEQQFSTGQRKEIERQEEQNAINHLEVHEYVSFIHLNVILESMLHTKVISAHLFDLIDRAMLSILSRDCTPQQAQQAQAQPQQQQQTAKGRPTRIRLRDIQAHIKTRNKITSMILKALGQQLHMNPQARESYSNSIQCRKKQVRNEHIKFTLRLIEVLKSNPHIDFKEMFQIVEMTQGVYVKSRKIKRELRDVILAYSNLNEHHSPQSELPQPTSKEVMEYAKLVVENF